MSRKYTQQEFEDVVNSIGHGEYLVLGVVSTVKSPIEIKHLKCGYIFKPQPYEFVSQGTRCPKCENDARKLGDDEFQRRVKEITDDTYIVLGEYVNNNTKILMKHKKCNQEFSPRPMTFLAGTRCPYCSGRRSNATTFKNELQSLVGNEYILIGEYKNKNTKVDLLHKKCNQIYKATPTCFINLGYRCPKCVHADAGMARRKSNETFLEEITTKFNGQLAPLEKYITSHHKILFKHIACGEVFKAKPGAIISDNAGCPRCNQSMPETTIEGILIDRKINYKKQVRFADCVGFTGVALPFDFVIYDKSNNVEKIIEYDGEQHYRASFGEKNFQTTQRNDAFKNEYCLKHNIKLIRIPYWEKYDLEFCLFKHLK